MFTAHARPFVGNGMKHLAAYIDRWPTENTIAHQMGSMTAERPSVAAADEIEERVITSFARLHAWPVHLQ